MKRDIIDIFEGQLFEGMGYKTKFFFIIAIALSMITIDIILVLLFWELISGIYGAIVS